MIAVATNISVMMGFVLICIPESGLHVFVGVVSISAIFGCCQARKVSSFGQVDLDQEVKRLSRMVYVPSWFTVDLKTGVSVVSDHLQLLCGRIFAFSCGQ